MSRTFRRPTHNRWMGLGQFKKVKDGTRTKALRGCENNQGCPYCEGNRLHKHQKQINLKQEMQLFHDEYWYYYF